MKKVILYSFVSILFILTPVCILGILGTGVSLKYEVEQAHFFIDNNDKNTSSEKGKQHLETEQHGRQLLILNYLYKFGTIGLPIAATTLLVYRKRIIGETKNNVA